MHSLDKDYAAGVLDKQAPPCLSLYQPTHRRHPENQQDRIRFRNLVKTLEASLTREFEARDVQSLLDPFWKLGDDVAFWNHTDDGLVVFGAPGLFRVYSVQRPVPELAIVAQSFHLKPLLRIRQSADRYHVLGLSRQDVRLFEGNRDALAAVDLPSEVEQIIAETLERAEEKPRAEAWSAAGSGAARHGHALGTDPMDRDTKRFFRAVDRAILDHFSRPSGLPLLLAALPEHHTGFRQVSRNPMLIEDGIGSHPDTLSIETLRERAWQVVEPRYLARLGGLIEMYGAAQSRELGTDDLGRAMKAAMAGRVMTLLLEADRQIPGQTDAVTGEIGFGDIADPAIGDLLDELGERVLNTGGQVIVVPAERMPTRSGLAVIYRF